MPERKPHSKADLFTAAPLPVATLDDQQRLACLRLIRSENVGPVTFRELINRFGGAREALDALPELSRRGGRTIRLCDHLLLKDGATLVTEPNDIISALEPLTAQGQRLFRELSESFPEDPPFRVEPPPEIDDTDRGRVLSALGPSPIELDEIARSTGLGVRAVRAILIELDLAGRIERHGSALVSRIAE